MIYYAIVRLDGLTEVYTGPWLAVAARHYEGRRAHGMGDDPRAAVEDARANARRVLAGMGEPCREDKTGTCKGCGSACTLFGLFCVACMMRRPNEREHPQHKRTEHETPSFSNAVRAIEEGR